ncbi:uncharacterized protein LOC133785881 [Humulus lupulus]|uniref:uncharacterized protein LOC133785881 n=1 Tax=Humulus lupulus TaxID=3486 RepID=UPI002B40AFAE|nr:uncharacterized protein LOC133785881 [Humulus lupulus]
MDCVCTPQLSFMINGSLYGFFQPKRGLRQGDLMSPLLFVIGMEYLSRILKKVANLTGFQFHQRCKSIKLTHLCFADDLLLFCKGDYNFSSLLLQGFKLFSNTSGLQPNMGKSAVYGAGLDTCTLTRIELIYGFQRSCFPFRYLGLKIFSKRLYPTDCECLVDRMTSRIRTWSSRNLSYAGRMCSWWTYEAPADASWYWKRIVQTKDKLKQVFTELEFQTFQYNIAEIYSKLRSNSGGLWPYALIWDSFCTPKHRVISWLAVRLRLPTKDRLFRIAVVRSSTCMICDEFEETHSYLFFSCCYSRKVKDAISIWLDWNMRSQDLIGLVKRLKKRKVSQGRKKIYMSAIAALVYFIWQSRNSVLWEHKLPTVQVIVHNIKYAMCNRIQFMSTKKFNRIDKDWVESLYKDCN